MRASAPTQRTRFGVVSCSYGGRERALESLERGRRCGGAIPQSAAPTAPFTQGSQIEERLRRGLKRENDGAAYIIYTRARVFSPLGKILSLGPFSYKGRKRGGAAWKTGRTRSGGTDCHSLQASLAMTNLEAYRMNADAEHDGSACTRRAGGSPPYGRCSMVRPAGR